MSTGGIAGLEINPYVQQFTQIISTENSKKLQDYPWIKMQNNYNYLLYRNIRGETWVTAPWKHPNFHLIQRWGSLLCFSSRLPLCVHLSPSHTLSRPFVPQNHVFNAYCLNHKVSVGTQLWEAPTFAELPFPPLFSQNLPWKPNTEVHRATGEVIQLLPPLKIPFEN